MIFEHWTRLLTHLLLLNSLGVETLCVILFSFFSFLGLLAQFLKKCLYNDIWIEIQKHILNHKTQNIKSKKVSRRILKILILFSYFFY